MSTALTTFDALRRHGSVLRSAWRARRELDGPRRLGDEAAFLPAALSLQETPVHPAPRCAMALILAVFTCALIWSIVGHIDIVAVAPGRLVVEGQTKLVQPLEAGVIAALHVQDGDRVDTGQVLVELDPTDAAADHGSLEEQLNAALEQAARAQALGAAATFGSLDNAAAAPADPALLRGEWEDFRAQLARLDAEITRRRAEQRTASEQLAKLHDVVPLLRQREVDIDDLAKLGFVAAHAGQDRRRDRLEAERDLSTQQARVEEAAAALTESLRKRAAYVSETLRTLNDRATEARRRADQLAPQVAKARHRQQRAALKAPVTGTVQQLAVHTTGGVVTPAQPLMVIVPIDRALTAHVHIGNRDIGFVRVGQAVAVKLDAFPFTRHGTVRAALTWVSRDAVVDEKTGQAVFQAHVTLSRRDIDVDGTPVSLGPGLQVTAEIKTGRRRVIEFLLSPIERRVSESLGER